MQADVSKPKGARRASSDRAAHGVRPASTSRARRGAMLPLAFPKGLAPRGSDAAALCRALLQAGIGHRIGGRGPSEFDCWSTVQIAQAHLFGRELLDVDLGEKASRTDILRAVRSHVAHAQWEELGIWSGGLQPAHGDVVTMTHKGVPWHVGTFLGVDRGVVLHCAEEAGICIDDRAVLYAKGFRLLTIHRYIGAAA